MTVPDGFEVTVFAAEPDVRKPVAMAFDERGRLWVAEIPGYPAGGDPRDRISVHEDTDGDGRADVHSVFADGLDLPTGLAIGYGGAFVAAAPDVVHLRDTDGDGKADDRRVLWTGFGRQDTHQLVHGLRWGPEGRLYLAQGAFNRSKVGPPGGPALDVGGDILRGWPDGSGLEIFAKSFTNVWGLDWDDEGNCFAADNDGPHVIHLVEGGDYGLDLRNRRAGKRGTLPGADHDPPGSHARIVAGEKVVYTDTAFPPEWRGLLLQADLDRNRILADAVEPAGASYRSVPRPDFLTCTDPWFRPLLLAIGPDGALYVGDWCNPVIAHLEVPLGDPRRDRMHGRIYRVAWKGAPKRTVPNLRHAPVEELLANLGHDNPWFWKMSQRMLQERTKDAPVDLGRGILSDLVRRLGSGGGRMVRRRAMWTLLRSKSDSPALREAAEFSLRDPDPVVRAAAVKWAAERRILPPEGFQDQDPRVVAEAWRAARKPYEESRRRNPDFASNVDLVATRQLSSIAPVPDPLPADLFVKFAMISAYRDFAVGALRFLTANPSFAEDARRPEVRAILRVVEENPPSGIEPVLIALLKNATLSPDLRIPALRALARSDSADVVATLADHLNRHPETPPVLVAEILEALTAKNDVPAEVLDGLLAKYLSHPDQNLRREALRVAAGREMKNLAPTVELLLGDPDPGIAVEAAYAIGAFKSADAVPALLARLEGAAPRLRWACLRALARIGDPRAADVLLAALEEPDSWADALDGLTEMKEPRVVDRAIDLVSRGILDADERTVERICVAIDQTRPNAEWEGARDRLSAAAGALRDWRILGPSPDARATELEGDVPAGEAANPWTPHRTRDPMGKVDLDVLRRPRTGAMTVFAAAVVESVVDRDAVLLAGSDDAFIVWVNGVEALRRTGERDFRRDEDAVRIRLKAGKNDVVVRCGDVREQWRFAVRIVAGGAPAWSGGKADQALRRRASAVRGEALFFGRAGCGSCHAVGDRGYGIGPDLTRVGARHPRSFLLESILEPAKVATEGYGPAMPTNYGEVLGAGEMAEIVTYLEGLR